MRFIGLQPSLEEILYPAMEDFRVDLIIGQGPGARVHPYQLNQFTLIGATTRAGLIMAPLRSRFGIVHRLEFYSAAGFAAHRAAFGENSRNHDGRRRARAKSRGAAGERRAWPTACCGARATMPKSARKGISRWEWLATRWRCWESTSTASMKWTATCCSRSSEKYAGGPVGVSTLAASLSEEEDAIEEIYEPYLMQLGLLDRTQRGRVATALAYKHFGMAEPRRQAGLFG